jgi:hypothetical protein
LAFIGNYWSRSYKNARKGVRFKSLLALTIYNLYLEMVIKVDNRVFLVAGMVVMMFLAGIALAAKPDFAGPQAKGRVVELPDRAVMVSEGLYYLGEAVHDGKVVQGYLFVKYKREFGKPPWAGGGKGKGEDKCYAYLAKGAKWKETEQYVLDTTNGHGLSGNDIKSWTEAGMNEWDDQVEFNIFGSRDTGETVDGLETVVPDGKNEIFFGSISEPGAIAMTSVWGIWGGPPRQREIVEYDMVFDEVDFEWGDADGDPSVMDYWNIFTHEIGHAAGMAHPSDSCTEETMYRFSEEGETKKRDLNAGDIAGIKGLY